MSSRRLDVWIVHPECNAVLRRDAVRDVSDALARDTSTGSSVRVHVVNGDGGTEPGVPHAVVCRSNARNHLATWEAARDNGAADAWHLILEDDAKHEPDAPSKLGRLLDTLGPAGSDRVVAFLGVVPRHATGPIPASVCAYMMSGCVVQAALDAAAPLLCQASDALDLVRRTVAALELQGTRVLHYSPGLFRDGSKVGPHVGRVCLPGSGLPLNAEYTTLAGLLARPDVGAAVADAVMRRLESGRHPEYLALKMGALSKVGRYDAAVAAGRIAFEAFDSNGAPLDRDGPFLDSFMDMHRFVQSR